MVQLPPTSALIHMSYADNTFSGKRVNMLNNMYGNIKNPDEVPQIYNPINSTLESLIKNKEIFDCYMENFKRINDQKETDVVFYYGNVDDEWDPKSDDLKVIKRRCYYNWKIKLR